MCAEFIPTHCLSSFNLYCIFYPGTRLNFFKVSLNQTLKPHVICMDR